MWAHCSLGIKMKIIDFSPPWKVWQEFNTFDPSQPPLSLPAPRSQETLEAEIYLSPSLPTQLTESSGLPVQRGSFEMGQEHALTRQPFSHSLQPASSGAF